MNHKMTCSKWIALSAVCSSLLFSGCEGDSSGPDMDYNGTWKGSTSAGGSVSFTVSGGKVSGLYLTHGNYYLKQQSSSQVEISGNEFSIDVVLAEGEIKGTFSSATKCSGSYSYSGYVIMAGKVSYSGTFEATKQ